ncbi:MAG: hypothetical protein JO053_06305 [Acidobacteria bacterium]|nr:hypothetical protein [Acidobacteriota bacterium]
MLRRTAALIFVLGIVGQAWAAACICDGSLPIHSCCKRKVEKNDYFSQKGCCEGENCVIRRSAPPLAGLSQAASVSTITAAEASKIFRLTFLKLSKNEPVRDTAAAGRYRSWPRAPDLYVRHHAFLI